VREGNKNDNTASLSFQVTGEAISDAALDPGTAALTSSDSTLDLAGAPSLFASTIPAPLVTQVGTAKLVTVYFGHDDFVLDTPNFAAVEALAEQIHFMVDPKIKVDSYASGEGKAAENQRLSEMRRETVIALLSKANTSAQFDGVAHGASEFAEAETGKGAELEAQRAQNRRVTIFILGGAAVEPEKKIKIFPPPPDPPTEEEILEQRLREALKQPSNWPQSGGDKTSVINKLWEKVDDIVDGVTGKFTDNKKIRKAIKDGVHKAIEKGSEEILDQALDQTSLGTSEKAAIKAGIKATLQIRP